MTALARRALSAALAGGLAATVAIWPTGAQAQAAAPAAVSVDFTKPIRTLSATDYGIGITGYGEQSYITNDPEHREAVRALKAGRMRIELHYQTPGDHSSPIICGGWECDRTITGDAWIAAIRDLGAEPVVILQVDGRQSAETNRDDAVALYEHFAASGTPVRRFILGNELNCTCTPQKPEMPAAEYSRRFNMITDALDAKDSAVRVGGPATAWNDHPYIRTFLEGSGARVDFLDYHDYGNGFEEDTDENLLGPVIRAYETELKEVSALAESVLGRKIDIQIGEFNSDFNDPTGDRTLKHFNTLWGAAALGQILHAGAAAYQYGDKNGQLGLTSTKGEGGVPRNEPLPIYHGIGMFTGENLFRSFGKTMVEATADNDRLHVFASDGGKNVVLVNVADEPLDTTLTFTGLTAGTVAVWQSTADAWKPHAAGTASVAGGKGTLTLPAASVTTLVIEPQATTQQGLTATYFDNADLTDPKVTRVDPRVDFDWGSAAPDPAVGPDSFSVRWTGKVIADRAETYTFITTSDDGVRLWVDGKVVVDNWTDHSKRDDSGQVALTAGAHDIKMEYYDGGYDAIAQLHWSSPTITRQTIPAEKLRTV
ncbi:Glycosyl hydrolases family 39 [Nonomuraea solani]|uniref:Glycosyl hydrolases family 39 n=1 Tax=Nonomuraea solani TaxID=1144553 RepID=A0A1H6DSH8_9ACTN|nr:PA14 domain-containing protein [Nonomuraea solani]SEG88342.1 Glycosyl hydrolases family 39 [Nonomuraea solani]